MISMMLRRCLGSIFFHAAAASILWRTALAHRPTNHHRTVQVSHSMPSRTGTASRLPRTSISLEPRQEDVNNDDDDDEYQSKSSSSAAKEPHHMQKQMKKHHLSMQGKEGQSSSSKDKSTLRTSRSHKTSKSPSTKSSSSSSSSSSSYSQFHSSHKHHHHHHRHPQHKTADSSKKKLVKKNKTSKSSRHKIHKTEKSDADDCIPSMHSQGKGSKHSGKGHVAQSGTKGKTSKGSSHRECSKKTPTESPSFRNASSILPTAGPLMSNVTTPPSAFPSVLPTMSTPPSNTPTALFVPTIPTITPSSTSNPTVSPSELPACDELVFTFGVGGTTVGALLVVPENDPGPSTCDESTSSETDDLIFPNQTSVSYVRTYLHVEYLTQPDTCYTATIGNIDCGNNTLYAAAYDYTPYIDNLNVNLYGTSGFLPGAAVDNDRNTTAEAAAVVVTEFDFTTTAALSGGDGTDGLLASIFVLETAFQAQPTPCQYSVSLRDTQTGECTSYITFD